MAKKENKSLKQFIADAEDSAQAANLALVAVEHPDVTDDFFTGRYSGIRLAKKDVCRAQTSDGNWLN